MPDPDLLQGELDFSRGDPAGFQRWQDEQADWLKRVRQESGLPVGRRVRLKLRDFDREIRGRLGLVDLPLESARIGHARFRVESIEFAAQEIEYCLRED